MQIESNIHKIVKKFHHEWHGHPRSISIFTHANHFQKKNKDKIKTENQQNKEENP